MKEVTEIRCGNTCPSTTEKPNIHPQGILPDKICRDCFRSVGDGFPYGEVKCIMDDQYKSEYRQCDTGGFISKNKPFPPGKYCLTILPNGAWQIEKATDWAGDDSLLTL